MHNAALFFLFYTATMTVKSVFHVFSGRKGESHERQRKKNRQQQKHRSYRYRLQEYRNTQHKDKRQRRETDFHNLKTIPEEYFENISQNSPESVLKLIGKIISVLLLRMNVPKEEVADFTDRVERRDFTMLFENFEAYDVQETRRISRAEGKAESILELLEDTGPVTADVKEQIMQEKDPERLRIWLKAAARAESVEQFTADNLRAGGPAGAE